MKLQIFYSVVHWFIDWFPKVIIGEWAETTIIPKAVDRVHETAQPRHSGK